MPSAMMNGTVMGPVVTPPESNAAARKPSGTNAASANTARYSAISTCRSCLRKIMRSNASTRKTPTPAATVRMSTVSGTDGICAASTVRSGSAIVTSTPMRKQTGMSTDSFLDLVRWEPMRSPIGIMDRSAPSVNSPMPAMSSTAPSRKSQKVPAGSGESSRWISTTIPVTGSTEESDSLIFASSCRFMP